ncbi:MAG: biopolymer transporter ExbD [bacterium]
MAFPASKRRHYVKNECNLNVIPVLNLFSSLIPFLLLCTVFASTAVIQLSLPTAEDGNGINNNGATKEERQSLNLSIVITDKGFLIAGSNAILPLIPKVNGNYNFEELANQLKNVKAKFSYQQDIILVCEKNIIYDLVIKVMDISKETGFPNIALSGRIQ